MSQIRIQPSDLCENIEAQKIDSSTLEVLPDSLYAIFSENSTGISIKVINTTNRTLYLFSTYLIKEYYRSKYIHRINSKCKSYEFSFTPIVSLLDVYPSDLVSFDFENPLKINQNVYNFEKLIPFSFYEIQIDYGDLFVFKESKKNAVKNFDSKKLNSHEEIKELTTKKLFGKYTPVIELAIYDDVSPICELKSKYSHLSENELKDFANSYSVLRIPVKMNNSKHPLLE